MIEIRRALVSDARLLIDGMDERTPHANIDARSLSAGIAASSDPLIVIAGGEAVAAFGVIRKEHRRGSVWFLTTAAMRQHGIQFARSIGPMFRVLSEDWDYLDGEADLSKASARAWLRRLGFTVDPERSFFSWRRECADQS